MSQRFEEIAAEAMKLPLRDRVRLARRLVITSDDQDEGSAAEIEALWLAEAERRFAELSSGVVQGITADEVFQEARDSLRR